MSDTELRRTLDDQIIDLLRRDVRVTRRRVAEVTGLPESTVRARMDRILQARKVQATVLVHPHLERSGIVYMLHIDFGEETDASALLQHPSIMDSPWAGQVAATRELVVQLRAASIDDLADRLASVRSIAGVTRVWSVVVLQVFIGANWEGPQQGAGVWAAAPTRDVDETDLRLISALRRDGRASYTELAEIAQLTVAATRRRVLRLVEDGLMRFAARIDDAGGHEASLDLRVSAEYSEALIADLCAQPAVRYVTEQTGEQNVACYVAASDAAALALAVERVRSDPRVSDARVSPIIRVRDYLSWSGVS
jgi:DNA-binding Lrp family transcriptional regulator